MDQFDAFIWLHIASHVTEFDDLCSLICTCHELYDLFTPLKEKYQDWHHREIHKQLKEIEARLKHIPSLPFLVSKQQKLSNALVVHKQTATIDKYISDSTFLTWLKASPCKALCTSIKRDHFSTFGYSCILHIYFPDTCGLSRPSMYWFTFLKEYAPSVFEYVFSEGSDQKISEPLVPTCIISFVELWLWYEPQPLPQDGLIAFVLTRHSDKIVKFVILDRNVYSYRELHDYYGTDVFCDEKKWNNVFSKVMFIVKTQTIQSDM